MKLIENRKAKENVLLVVVDFKRKNGRFSAEETLEEMRDLISACGGSVVAQMICHPEKPSATYLIGEGRVQEIAASVEANRIDTVIFSQDLKGSQQRNLEEVVKAKTIDRTQLILDIFARHATTQEGKMQVELAQLEYLLPRLTGKGIELSRLGGGIGTSGPGETKLEMDRRRIGQRITRLKRDLEEVASGRSLKRKQRREKGVPALCLVGYTNVGKSTLMNAVTQAGQVTRDGLFTTLDSLSRHLVLPNHQKVILSDTVGFMQDLPHRLIEAFKATLEEVREADLLVHVVDVSHPRFRQMKESVEDVLKELGALDKPTLFVFNKIDRLEDRHWLESFKDNQEHAVFVSAKTGENLGEFLDEIRRMLCALITEIDVEVPIGRMDLVNLAHEEGEVYAVKYYEQTINIRAAVPSRIAGQFYKHDVRQRS